MSVSRPLKERFLLGLTPVAAGFLRILNWTWRIQESGEIQYSPRSNPPKAVIYAVWHEIALAASFYHDQPIHALASQSFDGEMISRTLESLGYLVTARGSSTRGGSTGMLQLERAIERGEHALITVDGPRGPRQRAKDGVILLSQISGALVIPAHFSSCWGLRLRSWDKMIVPAPFGRGIFYYGKALKFEKEGESSDDALKRLQKGLDEANQGARDHMKGKAI